MSTARGAKVRAVDVRDGWEEGPTRSSMAQWAAQQARGPPLVSLMTDPPPRHFHKYARVQRIAEPRSETKPGTPAERTRASRRAAETARAAEAEREKSHGASKGENPLKQMLRGSHHRESSGRQHSGRRPKTSDGPNRSRAEAIAALAERMRMNATWSNLATGAKSRELSRPPPPPIFRLMAASGNKPQSPSAESLLRYAHDAPRATHAEWMIVDSPEGRNGADFPPPDHVASTPELRIDTADSLKADSFKAAELPPRTAGTLGETLAPPLLRGGSPRVDGDLTPENCPEPSSGSSRFEPESKVNTVRLDHLSAEQTRPPSRSDSKGGPRGLRERTRAEPPHTTDRPEAIAAAAAKLLQSYETSLEASRPGSLAKFSVFHHFAVYGVDFRSCTRHHTGDPSPAAIC
jgi:hypothetical protein